MMRILLGLLGLLAALQPCLGATARGIAPIRASVILTPQTASGLELGNNPGWGFPSNANPSLSQPHAGYPEALTPPAPALSAPAAPAPMLMPPDAASESIAPPQTLLESIPLQKIQAEENQEAALRSIFDNDFQNPAPSAYENPVAVFSHQLNPSGMISLKLRGAVKKFMKEVLSRDDLLDQVNGLQQGWTDRDTDSDQRIAQPLLAQLAAPLGIKDKRRKQSVLKELLRYRADLGSLFPWWSSAPYYGTLIHVIRLAAAAKETSDNAALLTQRTRFLLHRFLPAFYKDFFYKVIVMPSDTLNGAHSLDDSDMHSLTLHVDQPLTKKYDSLPEPEIFSPQTDARVPGEPIARRIAGLMVLAHEYSHGIFDEFVVPKEARPARMVGDAVFYAMTEGFAVMSELLLIDKMAAARKELGLSEKDVADLIRRKNLRIMHLKREKDHYTFGTLYFWHKIYKEGGEAGMLDFLRSLNYQKISQVTLSDPALLAVKGKPAAFKKFLSEKP